MQILVIGGGVAGLAAARELSQEGHKVVLVEASSRLGGRVHTLFDRTDDFPIELGPEFVHGSGVLTRKALGAFKKGGVKKLKQAFRYFDDGVLHSMDDFPQILKRGFDLIDPKSPDGPMSEVIRQIKNERERQSLGAFVEGFFAADPKEISQKSLEGAGEGVMDNSQVTLGYVHLVKSLRSQIIHSHYEEFLNQPIERIHWKKGSVVAHSLTGASFEAEAAIITVPIDCLKKIEFIPELPEKWMAAHSVQAGMVVKPVVRFKEPLWEIGKFDQEQIVSPNLNFTTRWVWKGAPKFQLTSWVGGEHARKIQDEPFEMILDLVLQDLSSITGRDPEELKKLVAGFYYHDWHNDQWVKGAYSFVRVGGSQARKELAQSIKDTLHFAGEATATDGSDGTVEGALKTGVRAAHAALKF